MWSCVHIRGIVSAADILFTPSVQRVLAATLVHPERAYTLQELLAVAASGRGNTQQQIERLLSAGVLVEEPRRGRQRSIKANVDYLLYPELCSILRKTFGVADPLKRVLQPFAKQIEEAFVFGSVAKGTDTVTRLVSARDGVSDGSSGSLENAQYSGVRLSSQSRSAPVKRSTQRYGSPATGTGN